MPTIKDIARAVGVSHATVSNVLNHKGNVSAQKVKLVMDAAKAMGYRVNEAASSLRSGGALVLAVILPDVGSTVYDDLYRSLCQAAAENGYSVLLRLTDNVPAAEYRAIEDVLASRARCAVVVSSLADPLKRYELLLRAGVDLVFALRGAPPGCISAGFDMEAIARDIASRSFADGAVERIALMTNMTLYPAEAAFKTAFLAYALSAGVAVNCVESISSQYARQAFSLFAPQAPDVIVTTCEEMALAAYRAGCFLQKYPRIYCLAPERLLPTTQYTAYQLNYRRLGYEVGRMLTCEAAEKRSMLGSISGFAPVPFSCSVSNGCRLSFLTADTPVAHALMRLAPRLKADTGLELAITTLPTEKVNRAFAQPELIRQFDLARMDLGLMECWAKALFAPIESLPLDLPAVLSHLLDGITAECSLLDGLHYALPFDPGCTLLFYREDLLGDPHLQREYYEQFHDTLRVPTTFSEFLQIAHFLDENSRKEGHSRRGAMITGRSSECISEFVSLSPNGHWPIILQDDMQAYLMRQRRLRSCAAVAESGSWGNAVSRFAQGECALLIAHSNYARHLADEPLSRVSGRVGYAPAPGGKSFLVGGVIGVLQSSARHAEAAVFLNWLFSNGISELLALLSGCSVQESAYQSEELADIYPWLSVVKEGFCTGVRRKIFASHPTPFDQIALEKKIAAICERAVREELTAAEATKKINSLRLY